nr:viral replicase [Sugarcane mild mosaic virus]
MDEDAEDDSSAYFKTLTAKERYLFVRSGKIPNSYVPSHWRAKRMAKTIKTLKGVQKNFSRADKAVVEHYNKIGHGGEFRPGNAEPRKQHHSTSSSGSRSPTRVWRVKEKTPDRKPVFQNEDAIDSPRSRGSSATSVEEVASQSSTSTTESLFPARSERRIDPSKGNRVHFKKVEQEQTFVRAERSFAHSTPEVYLAPKLPPEATLSLSNERRISLTRSDCSVYSNPLVARLISTHLATNQLLIFGKRLFVTRNGVFVYASSRGIIYATPVPENKFFLGYLAGNNHPSWLCYYLGRVIVINQDPARLLIKDVLKSKRMVSITDWSFMTFYDPFFRRSLSAKEGWCWAKALAESDIHYTDFPISSHVPAGFLNRYCPNLKVVSAGKYLHVSADGLPLAHFRYKKVGSNLRIDEGGVLDLADVEGNSCLKNAFEAAMRRPIFKDSSNLMINLDNAFSDIVNQRFRDKKRPHITIIQTLHENERDYLVSEVGDCFIEFKAGYRGSHSLLNAFRQAVNFKLCSYLQLFTVSSVGGSIKYHYMQRHPFTHICAPLLEGRDGSRRWKDIAGYFKSTNICGDLVDDKSDRLLNHLTSSFCNKRLQECHYPTTALHMVDVYDIPLVDFVTAMTEKGAVISYVAMMFPPELLHTDGIANHTRCNITVEKAGDFVTYSIGDVGESYTHRWSCIKEYLYSYGVRSRQGLYYNVELTESCGPYFIFCISLSKPGRFVERKPQRHFKAWMSNMTKVKIVLNEYEGLRIVEHFVERDFANRFLLYLTTAAPNVEDRTFEYALSGLRAHRSTMIVGSKIVHSKIDVPTDLSVQLASSFLREAVNRRHSNRRALRPLGCVSNLMWWVFHKLFTSLIKLERWIFRYNKTNAMYDDLAYGKESFLEDCPTEFAVETSGPVIKEEFEFKLLDEIVEEAQAMVLQQVTASGEILKEDVPETSARAGLFGGGKCNWYDFLLTGEIDSWNLKLWRFIRRSTRCLKDISGQILSMSASLFKSSGSIWKMGGVAILAVINALKKFFSVITRVSGMGSTGKKKNGLPSCLEFINQRSKFLQSVFSFGKSFNETCKNFLENTEVGRVLRSALYLQSSKIKKFLHGCVKPLLDKYDQVKHDLASSLMSAGLSYDPTWLKPFSLPKIKHCLKRALTILMTNPKLTPLPILVLWGLYHVLQDKEYKLYNNMRTSLVNALQFVGRYRLASPMDATQILIGVLATFRAGLPLVPIINIWKKHPVFEGIFLAHVMQSAHQRNLPLGLLVEAYSVCPLSNVVNMFEIKESEQTPPPSVKIDIGINHCTLNKPEFLKRVMAGLTGAEGKKTEETIEKLEGPTSQEIQPLDMADWDRARGRGKEVTSPIILSPRVSTPFEIGECSNTKICDEIIEEEPISLPVVEETVGRLTQNETDQCETVQIEHPAKDLDGTNPGEEEEQPPPPEPIVPTEKPSENGPSESKFRVDMENLYGELMASHHKQNSGDQAIVDEHKTQTVHSEEVLVGSALLPRKDVLPRSPTLTEIERVKGIIVQANLGFLLAEDPLKELTRVTKFPRVIWGEGKHNALLEWMTLELRTLWLQLSVRNTLEGSGFVMSHDGKMVHSSKNRNLGEEHQLIKYPSSVGAFLDAHEYLKPQALIYSLVEGKFYTSFSHVAVGAYPVYVLDYKTPAYALMKCTSIFNNYTKFFGPPPTNVSVTLFNAVPGGGKTHSLKRLFDELEGEADVLTANRGSAEEIREAFKNSSGWGDNIKTIDSYVISYGSRTRSPPRPLLIDECFLIHPGQIECVVKLLRPTAIYLYGDRRQIPFINRVLGFKAQYTNLSVEGMDLQEVCTSYRCPADVCWLLSQMKFPDGPAYSQPVRSNQKVPVTHSISHAKETLPTPQDLESCDAILTFCQSEKEEVRKHILRTVPGFDFERVSLRTVHESQGATYKNVLLVRTKWADDTVFSSLPHILVSLSRHNTSLKYYAPRSCREKGVGRYVSLAANLSTFVANQSMLKHLVSIQEPFGETVDRRYRTLSKPPKNHLEVINLMFDAYSINGLPLSLKYTEDMLQFNDFSSLVDTVTISESQRVPKSYTHARYVPNLNSLRPSKRPQSLISNLYVFEQRNLNADRGVSNQTSIPHVKELVDTFFEVYVDAGKYLEVSDDIVYANQSSLNDWVETRTSMGKSLLEKDLERDNDISSLLNKFKYMIKADMKCKLDSSASENIASGQNIVYHERRVCALFSSVFQDLVTKLKYILKPHVLLYHGVNLQEFADMVNNQLQRPLSMCYCGELDISKYDKSQNQLTKDIEHEIYRRLGIHPDLLDMWMCSDFSSIVGSMASGIILDIGAQRRTGSATTWFGNTLINMVLLSVSGDLSKFSLMGFSGDDSILLADKKFELSSFVYEHHYGFDVKFFSSSTPYFCSKFLLPIGDTVLFVPDALKLLVNLGAEHNVSEVELREKFSSFVDLTQDLCDYEVCEVLSEYIEERYGENPWVFPAVCCITSLRSNFSQFKRCWKLSYEAIYKENFQSFGKGGDVRNTAGD